MAKLQTTARELNIEARIQKQYKRIGKLSSLAIDSTKKRSVCLILIVLMFCVRVFICHY